MAQASAEPDLHRRAAAYRMHGERVDGNDVLAVREATARLLQRARSERRPSLLETVTYRTMNPRISAVLVAAARTVKNGSPGVAAKRTSWV